jgi:autotransporter-associated beta strand protein
VISKVGSGTVTLPVANTFTGQTFINAGAVRVASFGALGSGNAAVTIAPGGQLDIGGIAAENVANGFADKQFFIAGAGPGGSGAIVNNGGPQQFNAFQRVTLTADATIGGSNTGTTTTGRLDMRNNNPQLDLAGFTLTKTGNNQFSLVGVNVTDGNIVVNNGTLGIEAATTIADNGSGKSITYNAGPGFTTTAWFYNLSGTVTRPMLFNSSGGGTIVIGNASPQASTVGSNMTLNGPVTITNLIGGLGSLTLNGNILEGGTASSVTKTGPTLLVLAGNNTFAGGLSVNAGTVQVATSGTVGGGPLAVSASTSVNVVAGRGDNAIKVSGLSIAGGGTVDLHDNDIIVGPGTATANVVTAIRNARNNGAWDQSGLTSTEARNNPNHNTTLGVLTGAEYSSAGGTGVFSGQSYSAADTLVKYTYYGDTDFNGKVNFDDYVRTDNGFNNHLTGWLNGDFDLNGQVNFDDYVLIDLAFNTQSGTLGRALSFLDGADRSSSGMNAPGLRQVLEHFDQFGDGYARGFLAAVPEPSSLLILSISALASMSRRRRTRRASRR